jgi:hypothetical protein
MKLDGILYIPVEIELSTYFGQVLNWSDVAEFDAFTAVTMKNAVFWDIKSQSVPYRRPITSPLQSPAGECYVRVEVFMAVTMKNAVIWDVALCRSCEDRSFGGTWLFHFQGRKNSRARSDISTN